MLLKSFYRVHAERDIVMAYPSVRLSVTHWYHIETNAHIINFSLSGRGMS